jgi:hypothetical protein
MAERLKGSTAQRLNGTNINGLMPGMDGLSFILPFAFRLSPFAFSLYFCLLS